MTMLYPQNPIYKTVSLTFEHPAISNKTLSGRRQTSADGPATLKASITHNVGTRIADDELRPLWVFLNRCRGQLNPFDIYLHHFSDGTGPSVTGNVTQAAAVGYSVVTGSWPPNTVIRKAGDFIQFGNNPRAYMLADDLASNGSGSAVAQLATPLIKPVSALSTARVNGILFRMVLDANTAALTQEPGRIQQMRAIGMEEYIHA